MKIIGIDAGGSNTQMIVFEDAKIKYLFSETNSAGIKLIKQNLIKFPDYPIAICGGQAKEISKILKHKQKKTSAKIKKSAAKATTIEIVDEITSIGTGAIALTKKNRAFVVNIGTGTAMVSVNGKDMAHICGTGLGGGMLAGLSRLILKNKDLDKVEKLATAGKRENIDLTIKDILGSSIGKIPANATASNFGKLNSFSQKDLAAALLNMLAESIATLAFFASKNSGLEKNIVFCGKVSQNKIIKKRLKETVKIWGGIATIPQKAEYACAIGAAKHLFLKKSQ